MKSKTNVWTCADDDNATELTKAMRLVPSAAGILGWSFLNGKRRGISVHRDTGVFEMSSSPDAVPATILHIAAVIGSVEVALVAFAHGARLEDPLLTIGCKMFTALDIARANVGAKVISEDVLHLFEAAVRRQNDALGKLEEDEAFHRQLLVSKEERRLQVLQSFLQQGIVDLVIEIRGLLHQADGEPDSTSTSSNHPHAEAVVPNPGSSTSDEVNGEPAATAKGAHVSASKVSNKQIRRIVVRRCISKRELQDVVDRLVGQSTSISFVMSEADCSTLLDSSKHDSTLTGGQTHSKRQQQRVVELNARNIIYLLGRGAVAHCIARPLLSVVQQQDNVSREHSSVTRGSKGAQGKKKTLDVSYEDVRQALSHYHNASHNTTVQSAAPTTASEGSPSRSPQRVASPVDELREVVAKFDLSATLGGASSLVNRTISSEDEEALMNRLYAHDLSRIRTYRDERFEYISEGASRLQFKMKRGGLTPELEESVARLSYEGVTKRAERIAELDAALQATVPRAKESSLPPEDADEARERLTSTAHRQELLEELRQKYHGDMKKHKVLSKDQVLASVQSVYAAAMEKKAAAMAKAEAQYGDFQAKKKPSIKISRDQEKAIGERLTKK